MAQSKSVKHAVKRPIKSTIENPWFEQFARFGYAAKGVVYLIAGMLSVQAAFGYGGAPTDNNGALLKIVTEPFGKALLILIGVGLIGYVALRFVQALLDPEHRGTSAKGIITRIGYLISGFVYAGLAWTALQLATGSGGKGANQSQDWVSQVFALPFGRWLIGIISLVMIAGGLYQLYQAYKTNFSEHFNWNQMTALERIWAVRLGRLGLIARGIIQGLIGFFLLQATIQLDARKVQSSTGVLQLLAKPPFGLWAIAVVAFGLVAYGIYMLAAARYIRIDTSL